MQMLQRHFTDSAIAHILGIRCPDPLDVTDRAMWRWTSRHNFELKSAYLHLPGSHWPPRQAIWKLIWKMAVPQRIRLFLWLASQHRLMTNATRHCRNLAPSPTCPLCRSPPETVLHTLRDCAEVRHLWSQVLPDAIQRSFFGSSLHIWLSCNLSAAFMHPTIGLPCIAWAHSFHGSASATPATHAAASLIAKAVSWKAPEQGWVCLNVDGAVSLQSGSDCRQAIDLIHSAEASSSALSLVRAITSLRRMDWEITII
ncbi:hypothetical protein V6N12_047891 [Hibiscus sabdariffa]|uniref:Reverse transcriptase zinc-binding domain-containing protein n=1 Tax=Hibiscus sabdariffa TaxID=183260 RepID=A0ABR2CUA8_9ROSI